MYTRQISVCNIKQVLILYRFNAYKMQYNVLLYTQTAPIKCEL